MRLSLILPTYNEAKNVPELLRRIAGTPGLAEVIIVDDDSPDRTWEVAEGLKSQYPFLSVLRRIGKKGLSSAVTDGCDAASGEVLAVMDSDLQHDPAVVSQLVQKIQEGASVAVASRYREGGSVGEWVRGRRWLSKLGTFLAQKLPNVETSDPMSGFFAVRADAYEKARPMLRPEGFKILFELLAALPRGTRLEEVPLQFQPRLHGESKLSLLVQLQFLKQALRIGLRRIGLTAPRVFLALCIILAVAFGWRARNLRLLYVDPGVRQRVQTSLERLAETQGWLLSDLSVRSVYEDFAAVDHRIHRRGADARTCFVLFYDDLAMIPCIDFF